MLMLIARVDPAHHEKTEAWVNSDHIRHVTLTDLTFNDERLSLVTFMGGDTMYIAGTPGEMLPWDDDIDDFDDDPNDIIPFRSNGYVDEAE